ncbi:transposase, partial [Nonomuraea sp. NPDC050153]|uniref:transposase n=1 Tax=Nonomuraea sp. NPDC050153 TaxID=3364359 RepID=UPI0037A04903
MTFNLIPRAVERGLVFPPNIRDWLPPEHLCWKIQAVVEELDLSGFLAAYRADGRAGAAYHPEVLLGLVLYCNSKGIRSSRKIEAACWDDVGCRIITGNHRIDHATIARFIRRHRLDLKDLFVQVLALCARRGLVDLSAVAVDGSPMEANAGREANRSLDQLEVVIAEGESTIEALLREAADRAAGEEQASDDAEPLRSASDQMPTGAAAVRLLARVSDRVVRARSAQAKLYQRALPSAGEITIKVEAAERMVARAERRLAAVTTAQQARLDDHARRAGQDRQAGRRGANGRPPVPLENKTVVVRQRARLAKAIAHLERARTPRP